MAAPGSTGSLELERTYLVREVPHEIKDVQPISVEDTYIPADLTVHPQMRIRRQDDKYQITKKLPVAVGDGSAHMEHTLSLDKAEYEALRNVTERKILKERYRTSIGGRRADVDIFKGPLTGLVLIDFEFETPSEMQIFTPPSCCLVDVTQQEFLAGGMLSGRSYENIASRLASLGYTRLEA